ncbi:pseudouridine synthase [Dacryopinax primogenitus]|uniref:Pseudouridylate synthase RPUSD4, mitochondrial n=1 Tax=Dacryopinax primogenitus (strain DJM 731) TaxID=1858805 RepID=M5FNL7_DACPD|nr:pseudouridine synthase [Dacryopinax primogenitus]EJT97665.1 pseudouridine synthase [Dacryopinax primogenitus]
MSPHRTHPSLLSFFHNHHHPIYQCRQYSQRGHVLLPSLNVLVPILYRDRGLLAISKPAGMNSQGNQHPNPRYWAKTVTELLPLLQQHFALPELPLVVHRLDRPVTGVLLFALNPRIATSLHRLWASKQVKKQYVALVRGNVHRLHGERGIIDNWLERRGRFALVRDEPAQEELEELIRNRPEGPWKNIGVPARCTTHWEVQAYSEEYDLTLLSLSLITGFYHQLRAHCSQVLGCPILGDARYDRTLAPFAIERRRKGTDTPLLLHAARLSLPRFLRRGEALELGVRDGDGVELGMENAQGEVASLFERALRERADAQAEQVREMFDCPDLDGECEKEGNGEESNIVFPRPRSDQPSHFSLSPSSSFSSSGPTSPHPHPPPKPKGTARKARARRYTLTIRAPLPQEFREVCERAGLGVSRWEREGGVWLDGVRRGGGAGGAGMPLLEERLGRSIAASG